jgi:hypothetical protein
MVGLILFGFLLRILHLDAKSIWVDEANPWYFASIPLLESIRQGFTGSAINSSADPTYGILLHYWIILTGNTLFGLRYLSVILNLLGAAYLGRVTARAFGWRAGRAALFVGMIAPVWVYFSQEIRPYSFTPALTLVMVEAVIRISKSGGLKPWPWVMLAVAEALAVYTHGFMAVAAAGINVWVGFLWLRTLRTPVRWTWLRNWVFSQIGVVILLGPVLALLLARSGGIQNPFTVPLDPIHFASLLWSYFMGIPWENVFDPITLRIWAGLAILLMGLALAVALRQPGRRPLADLAWLVLGLAVLMFIYDQRDPSFHPRYAVFITGPLFMLLGVLISKTWGVQFAPRRWLSVALTLCLVIISASSISSLYSGGLSGFRHPDTIGVANTLKETFGPEDGVVVVAPHDFTTDYYGHGDAPLAFSRFDEGVETPADLLSFVEGKKRIGVLRNNNEHSDSRRILPFYLERYGSLVKRQYFEGYDLSTYRLDPDAPIQQIELEPATFNFGDLQITGMSVASGDSVTIALRWATPPSIQLTNRYVAAVRLTDKTTNWDLGESDMLLYGDGGQPTDWWLPGETTTQYFVIPLQPGTPPIDVDISVTVYDQATGKPLDLRDQAGNPAGQQAQLGSITLGKAPESWAYEDTQRPWKLNPITSEAISGVLIDQPTVAPGGMLGVTIQWAIPPDDPRLKSAMLALREDEAVIAQDDASPLQGRTPAEEMPWLDRRLIHIDGKTPNGAATLVALVGDQEILLGTVAIEGILHEMSAPTDITPFDAVFGGKIKLIGYRLDAPEPLTGSDTVAITLYWQSLADSPFDGSFKVFAHLLAEDGHLIGQHDSIPAGETRPFSGWITGEYVTDDHPMAFIEPYSGPVQIQIGLYDPATFQRVFATGGTDSVILPIRLRVESEP